MKRVLLTIMTALVTLGTFSQITRVEPPMWWAGMKNPHLQLMVYGEGIVGSAVEIAYPGVKVAAVNNAESPNYIFVDLTISPDVLPGEFMITFSKEGKKIGDWKYELMQREEGSAEREGIKSSDVMYLIMPDRFANGDPSNDEVAGMKEKINRKDPTGRHGGDIKGISDNLGYLKDMGFTSVWLNPILENNMSRTSYHGYATTDFYKVDPRYGSNQEYLELSRKMKGMGMKMIMDMIFNHCGSEHWWMDDLPFSDWLNFQEGFVSSHRRTVNQDPHASEYDKKMMTDGWLEPYLGSTL